MASQIFSDKLDLEKFLCTPGNVINATYLFVPMMGLEKEIIEKVPQCFYELIERNMGCYHEDTHFKYYPILDEFSNRLGDIERKFATQWY